MTDDEIRQEAKRRKIKSWHNKKIDKIKKELAVLDGKLTKTIEPEIKQSEVTVERVSFKPKEPIKPKLEVKIDSISYNQIKNLGIKDEWIASIANQYGFEKLEYMTKFKSFRCYLGGRCADWVSLNDLSIANGGKNVIEIMTPSRPVNKKKAIIKFPWRNHQ